MHQFQIVLVSFFLASEPASSFQLEQTARQLFSASLSLSKSDGHVGSGGRQMINLLAILHLLKLPVSVLGQDFSISCRNGSSINWRLARPFQQATKGTNDRPKEQPKKKGENSMAQSVKEEA